MIGQVVSESPALALVLGLATARYNCVAKVFQNIYVMTFPPEKSQKRTLGRLNSVQLPPQQSRALQSSRRPSMSSVRGKVIARGSRWYKYMQISGTGIFRSGSRPRPPCMAQNIEDLLRKRGRRKLHGTVPLEAQCQSLPYAASHIRREPQS